MTKQIHTITGPVEIDALGLILPHEHLFTDLRGPTSPGYAQAEPEAVVRVVKPHLEEASAAGVTALVECSTVGVGRNLRVLQSLAEVTTVQIIAPTGSIAKPTSPRRYGRSANTTWPISGREN